MAKNEWHPHPKQIEALQRAEFEVLYGGARGPGKAQPYDSLVLTPKGFKPLFKTKVGDEVVSGSDGSITKVAGFYPQGNKTCYKITMVDGSSCECCEDHLWYIHFSSSKKKDGVYSLKEILEHLESSKNTRAITPIFTPHTTPAKNLLVDPYLMGLFLGDGCLRGRTVRFSTKDNELLDYINSIGFETRFIGGCDYTISDSQNSNYRGKDGRMVSNKGSLINLLRGYKVHGCLSYDKFIPQDYKEGSVEQRFALLQGLMDTDGTSDKNGHVTFCSVSEQLCKDLREVVWSLGGKATLRRKERKSGLAYELYIKFMDNSCCFKLERKLARVRGRRFNGGSSYFGRRIKTIEPGGERFCICIKVDDESGLYVTNDYIVTHNTDAGIVWMQKTADNKDFRGLVIRKNADDLHDWIDRARAMYAGWKVEVVGKPAEIRFPSGAKIRTGHLKDDNAYEKYQGHEYQRMLIEELTQIPDEERYLKLISSCRSTVENLPARVFLTTNPGGPGHQWVKKRFVDPQIPGKPFRDPVTNRTRIFIQAKVQDNPTLIKKDPSYIQFLDGLPFELRKAWRDGDWDVFVGMFFTEFDRDHHVYDPREVKILDHWPRFRSIDWGYAAPMACYWHAVGPDSHIYTYREYYKTGKLDVEAAREIKALSVHPDGHPEKIEYTVGDPQSFPVEIPHFKFGRMVPVKRSEVWAEEGVPLVMGNSDRIPGWSRMREFMRLEDYMGKPSSSWHISVDCHHLIQEMMGAIYDKNRVEDVSSGCEDHALESCRLGLMSRPPRFVETNKPVDPLRETIKYFERQRSISRGSLNGV